MSVYAPLIFLSRAMPSTIRISSWFISVARTAWCTLHSARYLPVLKFFYVPHPKDTRLEARATGNKKATKSWRPTFTRRTLTNRRQPLIRIPSGWGRPKNLCMLLMHRMGLLVLLAQVHPGFSGREKWIFRKST